jgi:hypothetical protein
MSQDQFDGLTQRLAATTSRREVLMGLAAGALHLLMTRRRTEAGGDWPPA